MAAVEGGFGHCRGNAETVRRQEYRTLVGSCFAIAVAIAIAIANIIAISIAPAFALSLVVETGFFIAMLAQLHQG